TYVRRFLRGVDAGGLSLPTAQVLVAAVQLPVVLVLWWLIAGEGLAAPWSLHTPSEALLGVGAVVVLGVVSTALAQAMQYDVVRAAGPTVATSVTYLIPVVSVVLGVWVLGEQVGPVVLLGAAVVVGASLALLPADLRERLMLGDTGANALGGVLGLGVVLATAPGTRLAVMLALVGLNAAGEVVSFSRIIDAVAPLRALDRVGRRR
nr:EamA family transporter [Acidimicrobiia bacterium]